MQNYDPMLEPDPERWEALDGVERISVVMEYHQEADIELPDDYTHAVLHVIIENQIALGEGTPVEAVLRRLIDENLIVTRRFIQSQASWSIICTN